MEKNSTEKIEIPFYNSTTYESSSTDLFSFKYEYNKKLMMFEQKPDSNVKDLLQKSYSEGSILEVSLSKESGNVYFKLFINFLKKHIKQFKNKAILEIGYGNGSVLKYIEDKEPCLLFGIEPGNNNFVSTRAKLINDFFPSESLSKIKFDLIYTYGVVEHINNPVKFINSQLNHLKDKAGIIVFAIPNCQPNYDSNDISMFTFEHFNYFKENSIISIVNESNGYLVEYEKVHGMFFVAVSNTFIKQKPITINDFFKPNEFQLNQTLKIKKLKLLLSKYENQNIAIYVPLRAINYFTQIKSDNVRIVDDSSFFHGKKIPFFTRNVENFNDLIKDPPKLILIFSKTFGLQIKERIEKNSLLKKCETVIF